MRIKKIINNSIVCAVDDTGDELIVTGKGIGFQRHRGETLDPSAIERITGWRRRQNNENFVTW